jgi:hypothetical protein
MSGNLACGEASIYKPRKNALRKPPPVEAVTEFIQISLQMLCVQSMERTVNEGFCV